MHNKDRQNFSLLSSAIGGQNVSPETIEVLNKFAEMLLKWNEKINLVSKKITIDELWLRHVLDSAQLLKYLPKENSTILDLGSGAGFPGIILAILTKHKVVLVESDQRKCAFMQEVGAKFKLNIEVINSRIENLSKINCDVITSRALASLKKLFDYSESILQNEVFMLFLKGQNIEDEIREANTSWDYSYELYQDAFEDSGKIIRISNVRRL